MSQQNPPHDEHCQPAPCGPDLHDQNQTVHISEALAASLVDDGVHFATCDDVTVHAEGTALSCSVKDLTDLGVDHVVPDSAANGELVLALGLEGCEPTSELLKLLQQHDQALFPHEANVGLLVTEAEAEAFSTACGKLQDQVVEQLVDLGIDYVKVIGTNTEFDLPDHHHS
jgi:hypothetical protein